MAQVIGVRFKDVGKIYYFDPLDLEIIKGSQSNCRNCSRSRMPAK